jgi:hypothetical protein
MLKKRLISLSENLCSLLFYRESLEIGLKEQWERLFLTFHWKEISALIDS